MEILYANERLAKTFGGPEAKPCDYVGKRVNEFSPERYAKERQVLFEKVMGDGRSRLIRSVWLGWQCILWYTPLSSSAAVAASDAPWDRVLAVARRLPGIGAADALVDDSAELIYADAVDLGPLSVLTTRELEVVALVGAGMSIKEVGAALHRSPKTIEKHRLSAGQKLGMSDRAELIQVAHRAGLMLEDAHRVRMAPVGAAPGL